MLQRDSLNHSIQNVLNDFPEIAQRWRAGDPTVTAMLTAVRELAIALSRDNEINMIEPFIKSKDSTIIADAINKGILPIATPCQHLVVIENQGSSTITLSQGRLIEDGMGRQWRLLSSITVAGGESQTVVCEQSVVVEHRFNIVSSEPFYQTTVPMTDDNYLASIAVKNISNQVQYQYTPKFMNAKAGDFVFTLFSDNLKTVSILFGDDDRVGQTVRSGDQYAVLITQTYGQLDVERLKQATLMNIHQDHERYLNLYFQYGGLVRAGTNPLTVSQMRLLSNFPSVYDHNAVFMGNFDMLVRQHFMSRFHYMAIWNETIHEKFFGASLDHINHLNLAVVAIQPSEQNLLIQEIQRLVAKADNLLEGRVRVMPVVERSYQITINGSLSGVHDIDAVKQQIKELLLAQYGKGKLASSYPNNDGFNRQEMASLLKDQVLAFQDKISDFVVIGEDVLSNPIKPNEWVYLTRDSIHINLSRTADVGNHIWTL